jgi:glycosyltransferase involved in cell wall biosynthesis
MDSIRWTPTRLASVNQSGLGGSVGGTEAMTVGLCRELQARGHDITLWVTHLDAPGVYGDLRWRSVERHLRQALLYEPSPDVIVAVRQPTVFTLPELDGLPVHRVLWAGDVLESSKIYAGLNNVDTFVYVSDWQREQWQSVVPALAETPSWITPVALDPAWIPHDVPREPHTFIYASQPDRGLVPLVKMWPAIRAQIPDATLLVTGYTADLSRMMILADRVIQQANQETGGIEPVRCDDKPSYFRQMARASLLLYPGAYFQETNGHVCSEAMACGVIPLVTNLGALSETVPTNAGVLFDGDSASAAYQASYVAEIVRLASSSADADITARAAVGRAHVLPRCTYQAIGDLWDQRLREVEVVA